MEVAVYQRTKSSIIILGVAFTLLGLVMFIFPTASVLFLTMCIGWLLIFGGAATLINHFRLPKEARSGADLAFGIVEVLLGLLIIVWPGISTYEICLFIGCMIVVSGVYDCIEAFSMRGVDGARWGLWLVLGILTVICGIVALLSPFMFGTALALVIGISLVFDGITEIVYGVRM
jgi:uncharacterized membrane protein HdeD (DUF308 family)